MTEKDFLHLQKKYTFKSFIFNGIYILVLFASSTFLLSHLIFKNKYFETPDTTIVLLIAIPLLFVSFLLFFDVFKILIDIMRKVKFVGIGKLKEKAIRINEDLPDNYILTIQFQDLTLTAFTDRNFFDIIEIEECFIVEFLPKSKKVININYKNKERCIN